MQLGMFYYEKRWLHKDMRALSEIVRTAQLTRTGYGQKSINFLLKNATVEFIWLYLIGYLISPRILQQTKTTGIMDILSGTNNIKNVYLSYNKNPANLMS